MIYHYKFCFNLASMFLLCVLGAACSPIHLAEKGKKLEQKGKVSKASAKYSKALERDRSCGLANYHLANLELSNQSFEDSVKALKKIESALTDPEISRQGGRWHTSYLPQVKRRRELLYFGMAKHYFTVGHFEKGMSWLRKVLARNPHHQEALKLQETAQMNHVRRSVELGKYQSALEYLDRFIKQNPEELTFFREKERIQLLWADHLASQYDYQSAIELYESVIKSNPSSGKAKTGRMQAKLNWALLLKQRREYDASLTLIKGVLHEEPNNIDAITIKRDIWFLQASDWAQNGLLAKSLARLDQLLAENPTHKAGTTFRKKIWLSSIDIARANKNYPEAMRFTNLYLSAEPGNRNTRLTKAEIAYCLGLSLYAKGNKRSAFAYLDTTAMLGASNLANSATLRKSWILYEKGEINQAIDLASPLTMEAMFIDTAMYHLARYFTDLGERNHHLVQDLLSQLIKEFPDSYEYFRKEAERKRHFFSVERLWWFQNWINRRTRIKISRICAKNIPDEDMNPLRSSDVSDPMIRLIYQGVDITGLQFHPSFNDKESICWPIEPIIIDIGLDEFIEVVIEDFEKDLMGNDLIAKFYLKAEQLTDEYHRLNIQSTSNQVLIFEYDIEWSQAGIHIPDPVKNVNYSQAYFSLVGCVGFETTSLILELSPVGMMWDVLQLASSNVNGQFMIDWKNLSSEGFLFLLEELIISGKLGEKLLPISRIYKIMKAGNGVFDCYQQFNISISG